MGLGIGELFVAGLGASLGIGGISCSAAGMIVFLGPGLRLEVKSGSGCFPLWLWSFYLHSGQGRA